jgi:uncharacterized protein YndB with AHSA1/START domain
VRVHIDAPIERVWRALCDSEEVSQWDGAVPLDVPTGYPRPGDQARWRVRIAGIPVALHDHVSDVEAPVRLAAHITYGIVELDEEYRLDVEGRRTTVTSDNAVRGRIVGLGWLATVITRRAMNGALARLRRHCEAG